MNTVRRRKKRRKIKYHRLLFLVLLVVLLILGFMMLPIFNISTVEVTGNARASKENIIALSEIDNEDKFFFLDKNSAINKIMENTFIESVQINRSFPNKVVIEVLERKPAATLQVLQNYALIDKWGYVIDKSANLQLNLCNLKGIEDTTDIEVGVQIFKFVTAEQNKLLEKIFDGSGIDKFKSITLSEDKAELILNSDVVVAFGSYSNVEYKLKVLDQMIASMSDQSSQKAVMILMEEGPNPILVYE